MTAVLAVAASTMICCARNGLCQGRGESSMIEMRRRQLSFGDGLMSAGLRRENGEQTPSVAPLGTIPL
jgi:hypothetical protein